MDAIKYLADIKSVTDLVALQKSPDFDAGDPSNPVNTALEELLDRPDVQGSYFSTHLSQVVERTAEGQLNREELVELERKWIDIREPLEAFAFGEEAFDRALIEYEERAARHDLDVAHDIDPEFAKVVRDESDYSR